MRQTLAKMALLASLASLVPACAALTLHATLPLWALLLLALLGVPLGLLAGSIGGAHLSRRAGALAAGAMELTQGKLGVQVTDRVDDEIGRLAQIFNYASQQLLAYDGETRRLYQNLENGTLETMVLIANIIDSKDSFTHGHSQRVGDWASEIGSELGLPTMDVRHLLYGGLIHDVGKIGVIEPILGKRSALTDEEMDAMRAHPVIGTAIVSSVGFLKPVLPAVRHHHERWDGSGYPDKISGEQIPLVARIVAVADTWDALTSHRPYQQPMSTTDALKVMEGLKGKSFDPRVVEALGRVVAKKQARGERVSVADPQN
jgi:HD-GYP domain-containing protein (c-di-GMP phosphodiesterase class II)